MCRASRRATHTLTRLQDAINACPSSQRPAVFISSSAVGFYGTSESQTFSESSSSGSDYLAEVRRAGVVWVDGACFSMECLLERVRSGLGMKCAAAMRSRCAGAD